MGNTLLEVKDLKIHFFLKRGVIKAVDGISFTLNDGETMGIVGESGSGKSITVSSIMRLEPRPAARIVNGNIIFKGEDLVQKTQKEMQKIRGAEIAMIMQDPMTSLNPAYITGKQVAESIKLHSSMKNMSDIKGEVIDAFKKVFIPDPFKRYDNFPHEMSGGMRQRVVGAMALACKPSLLIADEPTTALDVTIQSGYMDTLKQIQQGMQMAMLFITHDLGIVARMCERVCVMYLGKIVEQGKTIDVWNNPRHKYTQALLQSIPRIEKKVDRLYSIDGQVPPGNAIPDGCSFHTRCQYASEICKKEAPPEVKVSEGHFASCWKV
jgi:peptide/nickel transport system ATP-binding protein/oligopeptide transport system ATP-binding protein